MNKSERQREREREREREVATANPDSSRNYQNMMKGEPESPARSGYFMCVIIGLRQKILF